MPLYRGDPAADFVIVSRNHWTEEITGGLSLATKMFGLRRPQGSQLEWVQAKMEER
jgi:hypothetical protein